MEPFFISSSRLKIRQMSIPSPHLSDADHPPRPCEYVVVGHQLQIPALSSAEALAFVLKDVASGPAFLELHGQLTLRGLETRKYGDATNTRSNRHLDDLFERIRRGKTWPEDSPSRPPIDCPE